MKILYVCHRFPYPPKRGGKIRPFNMISHLSKSHEVTVASIVRSDDEAAEGEGLREHCHDYIMEKIGKPARAWRMVRRLPTMEPSTMGFSYSPALERRIREAAARTKFDLAFVHCSGVAPYVADLDVPKILDFGDMDSQKWLAYQRFKPFPVFLGYLLEGLKLQLAEANLAHKFDLCTATTRAELATLRGIAHGVPTGWFPNGVDASRFEPSTEPYDPDLVAFIGRMDYFPNQECMLWFCREVMPLVQRARPSAKLVIVGAEPPKHIRRLGELPGVTVTGSVPEVQPYVLKAALTVAPLRIARGTQNKILEAMAMGVPTVCTRIASGGVDAVPGEHLHVADSPREYADAVSRILNDPAERRRLSVAGRERVLSHHSWASSMERLDTLIETVVSKETAEPVPVP